MTYGKTYEGNSKERTKAEADRRNGEFIIVPVSDSQLPLKANGS